MNSRFLQAAFVSAGAMIGVAALPQDAEAFALRECISRDDLAKEGQQIVANGASGTPNRNERPEDMLRLTVTANERQQGYVFYENPTGALCVAFKLQNMRFYNPQDRKFYAENLIASTEESALGNCLLTVQALEEPCDWHNRVLVSDAARGRRVMLQGVVPANSGPSLDRITLTTDSNGVGRFLRSTRAGSAIDGPNVYQMQYTPEGRNAITTMPDVSSLSGRGAQLAQNQQQPALSR